MTEVIIKLVAEGVEKYLQHYHLFSGPVWTHDKKLAKTYSSGNAKNVTQRIRDRKNAFDPKIQHIDIVKVNEDSPSIPKLDADVTRRMLADVLRTLF